MSEQRKEVPDGGVELPGSPAGAVQSDFGDRKATAGESVRAGQLVGETPSDRPSSPAAGPYSIKLQPTYLAQLQEALILESDQTKVQILAGLIEQAATREYEYLVVQAEKESARQLVLIQADKELREAAMKDAASQREAENQKLLEEARAARRSATHAALINVAKWLAPSLFAFLVVGFMIKFYFVNLQDAASSLREILILVIGGALGWAAQAKSDLNSIR